MDATYDKVLGKIKEASTDGEVIYFSVDDILNIKEELKYNNKGSILKNYIKKEK